MATVNSLLSKSSREIEPLLMIDEFKNAAYVHGIHRDAMLIVNHLLRRPFSTVTNSPLGIGLQYYLFEYPNRETIARLQFQIYKELSDTYDHLRIESVDINKSTDSTRGKYDVAIMIEPETELVEGEYTKDGRMVSKFQIKLSLDGSSSSIKISDASIGVILK